MAVLTCAVALAWTHALGFDGGRRPWGGLNTENGGFRQASASRFDPTAGGMELPAVKRRVWQAFESQYKELFLDVTPRKVIVQVGLSLLKQGTNIVFVVAVYAAWRELQDSARRKRAEEMLDLTRRMEEEEQDLLRRQQEEEQQDLLRRQQEEEQQDLLRRKQEQEEHALARRKEEQEQQEARQKEEQEEQEEQDLARQQENQDMRDFWRAKEEEVRDFWRSKEEELKKQYQDMWDFWRSKEEEMQDLKRTEEEELVQDSARREEDERTGSCAWNDSRHPHLFSLAYISREVRDALDVIAATIVLFTACVAIRRQCRRNPPAPVDARVPLASSVAEASPAGA